MQHLRAAILLCAGMAAIALALLAGAPAEDANHPPLGRLPSAAEPPPARAGEETAARAATTERAFTDLADAADAPAAIDVPDADGPRPLFAPVDRAAERSLASLRHRPMVVRERFTRVDVRRLREAPDLARSLDGGDPALPFDLFDDTRFEVVVDREDEHAATDGGRVWLGHVAGIDDSTVTVAVQEDATYALVQLPTGERYEVSYADAGVHRVVELDPSAFPPEQLPAEAAAPPMPAATADSGGEPLPPAAADETPAGNTIIDVMVVYTADSRDAAGGQAAIETRIQNAIALANTAYANSLVPITHQLVHQQLVDYTEPTSNAFHTALNDITSTSDGDLDEIHALRDQHGADVVSLLIDDWTYCGLAWITNPAASWAHTYGFNVNLWYCVGGTRTLHHEIGHNQGLAHDVDNASASGVYPYSYGLQVDNEFHTVMAYDSRYGCATPCPAINHFSNPLVNYDGVPTGIFDAAENARSLTETRTYVASWRATASPDGDGDGVPDAVDNCLDQANPSQIDNDSDGYGNLCDGDFDNNGTVSPVDTATYNQALMNFFPPGSGSTDMDGDGFVTPSDTSYFLSQLMAFFPGPSGLDCAGTVPCSAP